MDILTTIAVALAVAGLSPVFVFFTHSWIEHGRRKRAYERITSDPLYHVGANILRLHIDGVERPLMTSCEITKLEVGRIEIAEIRGNAVMCFTGREFEKLHPIFMKPVSAKEGNDEPRTLD